jgi:sterol desaturase/sphingolipid hydroxylase (fatty acid hydroxylase superfamily)
MQCKERVTRRLLSRAQTRHAPSQRAHRASPDLLRAVADSSGSWPKAPRRVGAQGLRLHCLRRKEFTLPTLAQLFTDPISLAFFGIYAGLFCVEALFPARKLPELPWHRTRGLLSFFVFFLVSSYLPYVIGAWFEPLRVWDSSALGTWGGAVCVMSIYQLLGYGYHRLIHSSDTLFRGLHQLHHSSERLDVSSAFWFSPLDMLGWTLVSTLSLAFIGVTPEAIVVFVLAGGFLSTFQHANLRTPRWLGYFIQRPESHSYHHGRGVHRNNYADIPVLDMLFGTFNNPKGFAPETGFHDGASARVLEMLSFRDVTQPKAELTSEEPISTTLAGQRLS